MELYCRKLGLTDDAEETKYMRWGTRMEPVLADAYEEETGHKVSVPPRILRHNRHTWMLASLDRVRDDGIPVELKTANQFAAREWGEAGTDQVPEAYLLQVQHQLIVADVERADLAVLIGGHDFRVYHVERNDRLCNRLIDLEAEFWERVLTGKPPEADWSHSRTPALMEALYLPEEGVQVSLGEDAGDLALSYLMLGESARQRKEVKARLIEMMGSASLATFPDGTTIDRKIVTRKAYSVEESSYTSFRVKQSEGKGVITWDS